MLQHIGLFRLGDVRLRVQYLGMQGKGDNTPGMKDKSKMGKVLPSLAGKMT